MIYNRRHPTEQYRVSLKLTSGALRTFFLSPGSKNAHPFWTLEDKITSFLQVQKAIQPNSKVTFVGCGVVQYKTKNDP